MWRSMGGILIKEMLANSAREGAPAHHRKLLDSTAGLVFYATPHHGSWLADIGWNLRFLGASPASSVVHLKPGSHLEVRPACPPYGFPLMPSCLSPLEFVRRDPGVGKSQYNLRGNHYSHLRRLLYLHMCISLYLNSSMCYPLTNRSSPSSNP